MRKAFGVQGVDIQFQFFPWKRGEHLLNTKQLDVLIPYTKTPERTAVYAFSDPIIVIRTHFFYLKSNIKQLNFKSYEELKPYRIGGILGYFYETIFDKAGLTVEYVAYPKLNIQKLLAGRIDIVPYGNIIGWHLIKNHFPEAYDHFTSTEFDLPENRQSDETIACRVMTLKTHEKSNQIIEMYNSGLKQIKQNGQYDNIIKEYGIRQ